MAGELNPTLTDTPIMKCSEFCFETKVPDARFTQNSASEKKTAPWSMEAWVTNLPLSNARSGHFL